MQGSGPSGSAPDGTRAEMPAAVVTSTTVGIQRYCYVLSELKLDEWARVVQESTVVGAIPELLMFLDYQQVV
jgi:hypothetical protein